METLDKGILSVENAVSHFFEDIPISLWEQDISEIKKFIDKLKSSGKIDFRAHFKKHPDVINKLLSMVKTVNINSKSMDLYEIKNKEKFLNNPRKIFTEESLEAFREEIIAFSEGKNTFDAETNIKTLKNKEKNVYMKVSIVPGYEDTWSRVIVYIIDNSKLKELDNKLQDNEKRLKKITTSIPEIRFWHLINPKKYEYALRKSYEILQIVMNNIPQYIYWKDTNSVYLGCNRNYAKFLGLKNIEDIIGKTDSNLITNEERVKQLKEHESNVITKRKPEYDIIEKQILENGNTIWLNTCRIPLLDSKKNGVGILVTSEDVTEKRLVLQNLKESEEKFRSITEQSFMGIGILQDDRLKYVNKQLAEIGGYIPDEMMSWEKMEYGKLIHPDDRETVLEQAKRKQSGVLDAVIHYQFRAHTKTGELKWLEIYSNSINYRSGIADLITIIDITDRKLAEDRLKESEKKYRDLANLLPQTICETDIRGNLTFVNNNAFKTFGYTWDDFNKGLNVFQMLIPEDRKGAKKNFNRLLQGKIEEPILDNEYTALRKDGSTFPVMIYSNPIISNDISVGVRAIIIDITTRKKAEHLLRESEKKYRDLIETSSMGLLEINLIDRKVAYINPRLIEIIGYTIEELNNETIFYKIIHPEDLQGLLKSHEDQSVEFRLITKGGKIKWLSGNRIYNYNEKGELTNLRLWLQEITKKKELEKLKSNLITRFSHEFKTPLISIKGFTEFLLTENRQNLDGITISFLNKIMDGCGRLETLINAFIESSQLGKHIIGLNINQENLYLVIKKSVEKMKGIIKLREHKINLNIKDDLFVNCDKEKIYMVTTDLLLNSIKYTPKGGEILIQSNITDEFITISIKDNGVGLTEEEKLKLFKPFGKIERYGQGWDILTDGMGLGLFISNEIINLHGGKIWVESKGRNKGSIFYFSLPTSKN